MSLSLRDQYVQLQQQEEVRKQQEHKYSLSEELRKFRREQLKMRQSLEKSLLIEVCLTESFVFYGFISLSGIRNREEALLEPV